MSGFSPEWLALREPADHASVNAAVRATLVSAVTGRAALSVVDLGCGAGSNLRGLAPALAAAGLAQRWTLVDYDARLLETARGRLRDAPPPDRVAVTFQQADFSTGDFDDLVAGADLVTAAALFDLVSIAVIDRLAAAVAARTAIFATVLTYDGIAAWLPASPIDNRLREAFNLHQRGDKGFGPAAGPDATRALKAAFERHGYRVTTGKSPWVLDRTFARLRDELDAGFAAAVAETGHVPSSDLDAWRAARRAAGAEAVTLIGHEDLVALPPE